MGRDGEDRWASRCGALLSERYNGGKFDEHVLVYSGGGYYYPGKEKQGLQDEMRQCRDLGYRLMKMKIGGAPIWPSDLQRIEWALEVAGDGENLAVDANGRFDLDTALAYAPGDAALRPVLVRGAGRSARLPAHTPCCATATERAVATGENLFSVQDFRNLLRHGGMRPHRDWLQPDPSLCYGLTEYLRILDMADRAGLVAAAAACRTAGISSALNMAAGLQTRRLGELSRRVPALRRLCRQHPGRRRLHCACTRRRASAWSCRRKMFADMRKRLELE